MKNALIILGVLLSLAGFALANSVQDIEIVSVTTSNTSVGAVVTNTAIGVNGWVNSVGLDVHGSGSLTLTLSTSRTSMVARTIISTNGITASAWVDPSDTSSRRYAVTDRDTFTLVASNGTASAQTYRAVIRVETANLR